MNTARDKPATDQRRAGNEELRIKKIVVAVDLSPRSEKTVAYAADFARTFGASISLVHVFGSKPVRIQNTYETLAEEGRHNTERKLVELAEKIRQTYPNCEIRFRNGDPAEQVTSLVQDLEADLVVTASHDPGLLAQLFGWDQASRILHRAPCPVLVYHEETDAT